MTQCADDMLPRRLRPHGQSRVNFCGQLNTGSRGLLLRVPLLSLQHGSWISSMGGSGISQCHKHDICHPPWDGGMDWPLARLHFMGEVRSQGAQVQEGSGYVRACIHAVLHWKSSPGACTLRHSGVSDTLRPHGL